MVYSNTTTLAGVIQTFERLTDSGYAYVSGDTTRLKEATNLANQKSHEILPIKAAIEWYKVKQPQSPTLIQLQQDDLRLEQSIREFYGRRFKDYKPRIGRQRVSYR